MKGYKAFEKGLVCRGKQYAENTVFEEEKAEISKSGMHFCKNPIDSLRRTWKNKVAAIVLMAVGYISMQLDGDGTALVLLTMLSMPLFFMRENVIVIGRKEDDE